MNAGTNHDSVGANQPLLLTVPEACAQLRISRWMFYRLVQARQLRTVKIGSRRLVRPEDVASLLEHLSTEGGDR
ncbi:DNA binding domain-containing protein, excisionase family [Frankineae bacterium MT45]|nr:DNA binding domain-containing protein, excisionase family [Frankineae bacterium MT45]